MEEFLISIVEYFQYHPGVAFYYYSINLKEDLGNQVKQIIQEVVVIDCSLSNHGCVSAYNIHL